ncbi:MAG: hypothetical protein J6Z50_04970 [Fibrobacterales bacterium]|nr:hypothetical protein [Fibrobacterales bacterium]MBP5188465.1 hypothetical protein [Fibrobacterales bacterium]
MAKQKAAKPASAPRMPQIDVRDPLTIYMFAMIAATAIAAALIYFLSIDPLQLEIAELQDKIVSEQQTLDRVLKDAARKPQFEKEVADAQEELARLKEMFPDEEKVPVRLHDLNLAVRQAGVRVVSVEPVNRPAPAAPPPGQQAAASDDPSSYYVENYYKLEVEGGYHQIGDMFAEMANFDYPTRIRDVKIRRFSGLQNEIKNSKSHGTTPVTMQVSFRLITFSSRK